MSICFKEWLSSDLGFGDCTNSTIVILCKHFPSFINFHLLLVYARFQCDFGGPEFKVILMRLPTLQFPLTKKKKKMNLILQYD